MTNAQPVYVAIVDDDENVGRSLGRLLRAVGMQPITYQSAEAFLADQRRPRFDCLLLDIHLGGMSGIELGQRLVAEGGHAPFIFITAHDESDLYAPGPKPPDARRSSARPTRALTSSRPSVAWRAELHHDHAK